LLEHNILGGLDISEPPYIPPCQGGTIGGLNNYMLLCVTEMNSREDIDALVAALAEFS
jgi:hypothetical protein